MEKLTLGKINSILPVRKAESHKGSYGKVLALCGCEFYRGAAALSVSGALRAGAGIVCLATEEKVIESVCPLIPEAIFLPLPNEEKLLEKASSYQTLLMGCGLEEGEKTFSVVKKLLEASEGTVVLDAGALTSCKDHLEVLQNRPERIILTPHIGEMAKLTGKSPKEILEDAEGCAAAFAEAHGVTVVLKSHETVIASPDGRTFLNTTGNAGLARGGSGDVLSGITAGLAAQGLSPLDSAVCGVFLHGSAADLTARRKSMQAMLPSDLLEDLGNLFLRLHR